MEPANLENFIRRYQTGESAYKLAKEVGVTNKRFAAFLRAANVQIRGRTEAPRISVVNKLGGIVDKLVGRYQAGESLSRLANEAGVNLVTLRKVFLESGCPLRSAAEAARQCWTKPVANLAELIRRYQAGETMDSLAECAGLKNVTLRTKFAAQGVQIRDSRESLRHNALDVPLIVKLFTEGESVNVLARRFGVARHVIALRLTEAGIALRSPEEAAQQPIAAIARAATRQARLLTVTPAETSLAACLRAVGVAVVPQYAAGTYNLDLALDGRSFAVEVEGGPAFRYPQNIVLCERAKYLLDQGWCVLFVVTSYKPLIFPDVAYKVVSLLERSRRDKSVFGQYGVIGRDGHPHTKARYQLHGLTRVPGF